MATDTLADNVELCGVRTVAEALRLIAQRDPATAANCSYTQA
jgi:hypothetical protein